MLYIVQSLPPCYAPDRFIIFSAWYQMCDLNITIQERGSKNKDDDMDDIHSM
ncbi:34649_t:CDS:1, partial [Racocetra persica]